MRTKESENTMIYSNGSLWGEANSQSKEAYQFDGERKDGTFRPFIKIEGGDAARWTPFLSNFSAGTEHGSRDSSIVENRNEVLQKPSVERNTESSVYVLSEGKKFQSSLENMSKSRDSTNTNSLFQTDTKSFSDKSVLEHDTFDSADYYGGVNEHVLKDISVDKVGYPVDKLSVISSKNVQSDNLIPNTSNIFRHGTTEGISGVEPSVSAAADDDRSFNAQETSKSQMHPSFSKGPPEYSGSVNLLQKDGLKLAMAADNVSAVTKNDPFVARNPQSQEYGTQRIFRSFLTSFNNEGAEVSQVSDQLISSRVTAPGIIKTASGLAEDEQEDSSPDLSPSNYASNGNDKNIRHGSPSKNRKTVDAEFQLADSKNNEHEKENIFNDTVPKQGKYDMGETSFSKASLIAYNEPIPHPGNISMRSDGSISSRSFAFPILQSEWNSSPVKMAKADRRHYRKQKGWRSGIFCCRF